MTLTPPLLLLLLACEAGAAALFGGLSWRRFTRFACATLCWLCAFGYVLCAAWNGAIGYTLGHGSGGSHPGVTFGRSCAFRCAGGLSFGWGCFAHNDCSPDSCRSRRAGAQKAHSPVESTESGNRAWPRLMRRRREPGESRATRARSFMRRFVSRWM